MISRRILAAVLLLCATQAHAQTGSIKTPAQLKGEINALFPDNTSALITPSDARQITLDQVASVPFLNTTSIFSAYQIISLNSGALPTTQTGTLLQLGNANGVISRSEVDGFAASSHFTGMRSEGLAAAPTAVVGGSEIVSFNAGGYNSSAWVEPRAAFRCYANQTWSAGANGTYCDVAVTANGAIAQSESIRFENDGGITVPSTVTGGDKGAGTVNAGGLYVNGTAVTAAGITALTGDVTATGPGSSAATLATVNSNVGTFGSATQTPQITVNAKGLVTAASNVALTPTVSSVATAGLATGGTITTTGTITVTAAVKSDQVTATSTSVAVVPAVQQNHPSAAKAWGFVTYSGATPTLSASYNVTSVAAGATGVLNVTLTTGFTSTKYSCFTNATNSVTNTGPSNGVTISTGSAFGINHLENGTAENPFDLQFVCFGTQ